MYRPTEDELESALQALKVGKSAGRNGITPEPVKHVGTVFSEHLLELFQDVWKSGKVLQDS